MVGAWTPPDFGRAALAQAEHARLLGGDQLAAWTAALEACRAIHEPHYIAYALLRYAEVLTATEPLPAAAAAREALALATGAGAAPLAAEIEARRAREMRRRLTDRFASPATISTTLRRSPW